MLETSQPDVFAAGDVRSGSVKRVASAVGEGSMAVRQIREHFGVSSTCGGVSAVVGNTDPVSLTDAELAAEVARDTGEVLLAVTHPGGSHPAGKPETTVLAPVSQTTGARTPRTQPLISSVAMKEHAGVAREWRRARLRANPGEQ